MIFRQRGLSLCHEHNGSIDVNMSFLISSRETAIADLRAAVDIVAKSSKQKASEIGSLIRLFDGKSLDVPLPFPFPCNLVPMESPDFRLQYPESSVGLEVTLFLAEQRARALAISSKKKSGLFLTPFNFNSRKRTNEDITKKIDEGPSCGLTDWVKTSSECDLYAQEMLNLITAKVKKVIIPKTEIFDEYWLVIDDRMILADLHVDQILPIIRTALSQVSGPMFDRIFFIFMDQVVWLTKNPSV